ncbi:transcription/translation regulatory transformer protein RfaH [Pseudidiomarina aestuarii]|uniref:Transcription/translation regulatory transformer protein RfaH n=1 Tax=Pseudidiomarina aestuarii TaxID=624146 RepID=A0A2T4D4I5_9GAMM|nr:transcription/translation regulatory transformer protein RfaH [Pseudidiomarina aestuarii]
MTRPTPSSAECANPNTDERDTWYVVRSKPRQEQRAFAQLKNQGMQPYLPKVQLTRVRRGKRKQVVEPLFPGYLFVTLSNYDEQFHKIRHTFGVASLLRFGNKPATLPAELIAQLRELEADASPAVDYLNREHSPQVGDLMEVMSGPFAGLLARILILDGDERCVVLLDWMQQQVKATFSYAELRRAERS